MQIQVLHFDGCPNAQTALELVETVVQELHVEAAIQLMQINNQTDAVEKHALGSPTILIDGIDIEPSARHRQNYSFACRMYDGQGVPSRALVEAAVREADAESLQQHETT